jgi:hypothetical protein
MRFWLLCLLAVLVCAPTGAEPPTATDQKFTWQYAIEWRLIRAGSARMVWSPESEGFQADLQIESAGLVSKLYRVNDDYRVLMNDQFCASTVNIHAEEGKRRRDTKIAFAHGKAAYAERDLVKNTTTTKEISVPECVHDYLGGLQRLRRQRPEIGQSIQAPLSDGKKFANVKVEAQEREEVTTPMGKFKAIRYEIFLFNDVLINKKARLFVWLTDDDRRLPVQIRVRMQFLIGTIELKLEKQEQASNL